MYCTSYIYNLIVNVIIIGLLCLYYICTYKYMQMIVLIAIIVNLFAFFDNVFQKCSLCGNAPVIPCHECHRVPYLCADCDREIHSVYPLHDRESWTGEYFKFIASTLSPDSITGNLVDVGKEMNNALTVTNQ